MQKIIEIEQYLLFFIDFFRMPKYRIQPIYIIFWFRLSVCVYVCLYVCMSVCLYVCMLWPHSSKTTGRIYKI